jgi:hypothetical protein
MRGPVVDDDSRQPILFSCLLSALVLRRPLPLIFRIDRPTKEQINEAAIQKRHFICMALPFLSAVFPPGS